VNGFMVALAVAAGLFGSVDRGPAMPVCRVDVPCDESAANVALVFTRQGKTIRTRTDDQGRYRIRLAPGYYAVRTTGKGLGSLIEPSRVRVRAQRYTRVNLHIDTGIR
jgi:Carboxypeptidase regulatory-like domain